MAITTVNALVSVASCAFIGSATAAPEAFIYSDEAIVVSAPEVQVGSGGLATPMFLLSNYGWSDSSDSLSVKVTQPMTATEQLSFVRTALGASITDLADLLDVSRPTLYSWMQGTEPRDEHLERLQKLTLQANNIDAFGIAGLGKLLKRPLQEGQTLLDLIKQDHPLTPALDELAALARIEEKQRAMIKGSGTVLSAAAAGMEQSMPGYLSGT